LTGKAYTFESKPSDSSIMHESRAVELYVLFFTGKGTGSRLSFESATIFVDRLFEHEDALNYDKRKANSLRDRK
jgi:hypothetical protein